MKVKVIQDRYLQGEAYLVLFGICSSMGLLSGPPLPLSFHPSLRFA